MSPTVPAWSRVLCFLCAGTLLFQTVIILACVAMEHANAAVGYLKYRLPELLFWIYVWVGIGAPGIALITLIILWVKRSSLWNISSSTNKRGLLYLIVLCFMNVCAIAVWFVFSSMVFFGAGGNR